MANTYWCNKKSPIGSRTLTFLSGYRPPPIRPSNTSQRNPYPFQVEGNRPAVQRSSHQRNQTRTHHLGVRALLCKVTHCNNAFKTKQTVYQANFLPYKLIVCDVVTTSFAFYLFTSVHHLQRTRFQYHFLHETKRITTHFKTL